MAESCNLGQASYSQSIGMSREQRRLFHRGRREGGRAVVKEKSIEVPKILASHWLGCESLIGWAVARGGEKPSSWGDSKVGVSVVSICKAPLFPLGLQLMRSCRV